MDTLEVIQPSLLFAPYVRQYWFLSLDTSGAQRIIPFGCTGITFFRGGGTYVVSTEKMPVVSHVSGQSTEYIDLTYSGNHDSVTIVLTPVGASVFFKIPVNELINRKIPIDILSDPRLKELDKRLSETVDNKECVDLIECFLSKRFSEDENYDRKRLTAVIRSVNAGESDLSELARVACLSYKQFKRIFTRQIGTGPKDFMRIMRFQQAQHLLQIHSDMTLIRLAHECGYYDKSHLIKEFKNMSGYTPGEFLSICDPYSEYHAFFRSVFLDLNIKSEPGSYCQ